VLQVCECIMLEWKVIGWEQRRVTLVHRALCALLKDLSEPGSGVVGREVLKLQITGYVIVISQCMKVSKTLLANGAQMVELQPDGLPVHSSRSL
jgi:hypothetical protein